MPQRDLVAELRTARVAAPAEVRERVRLIAAEAPPERRRFNWRFAVAIAVPAAAAVAAAIVLTRPSHHQQAQPFAARTAIAHGADTLKSAPQALGVPTSPKRVQTVGASIALRVTSISDAVQRAVAVATSLSGYAASVHAETQGAHGSADLTLKVPRSHVQAAIGRLSKLGTITSESIDLTDRTAGLNATDLQIARLQKQIAELRAAHAPAERIAGLVARVQALQRSEAGTRTAAHYATLHVHLATPATPKHASHAWRDAVFAALGAAVLALLLLVWRLARRLREDRLLSRS